MQFELNYSTGNYYCYVTFEGSMKMIALQKFVERLHFIGGVHIFESQYQFPAFVTSQVIDEIIRNTCFVCGGLMQDEEYHSDHILRKCTNCGHSHT